jgi:predicted transposase
MGEMVRTIVISLRPTLEQAKALLNTMEAFNAACNFVSRIAWENRTFRNYELRKLCYSDVRARFGLTAQLAQHAIKKVADAYRVSQAKRAEFHPRGAVTYDSRVLRLLGVSSVSIAVLHRREKVALSVGGYQADRIWGARIGESDLVYLPEKKRFRLHLSLKFPDPLASDPDGFLGAIWASGTSPWTATATPTRAGSCATREGAIGVSVVVSRNSAPAAPAVGSPSGGGKSTATLPTSTTASRSRSSRWPQAPGGEWPSKT